MTISETVEIESKFEVGPDTPVPAASAFAPLVADDPVVHELSATYYDTADLSLTRHKVTLRRRTGGDDAGWHLKLPSEAGRVELRLPLDHGDDVPDEFVAAVAGLVRRRPLAPVARVDNRRHVVLLRDGEGTAVVEFCDDHVTTDSLVAEGATAGAAGDWREWEVELVDPSQPRARDHLAAVATACTSAGARTSSSSSKLARAIGPLPDPPDRGVSAVRDALREDLHRVLDHDPAARRVTMVGVHQMRVAVRGLRSTISSFAEELEAETGHTDIDLAAVLEELKVLAAVLGKVRDIQVVEHRLGELAAGYPEDVVSTLTRQRLRVELGAEERRAGARVTAALGSERYLDLLDRLHLLVELAGTGPEVGSSDGSVLGPTSKKRRREAEDMILRGVDRQFAKFTKARTRTERDLESLELTLAQREELTHVVRKRAKALRRNVGALRESDGLTVAPLRTACQRLHTVLGDVQDSVTARRWIRRIARRAESAGESTFGFGVLYEHERGFSERALDGFENDAATVTAAYRELSESRRAARRRKKKSTKK
ncbi:CYTH and CHAD domain-containing protein [Dietzia sp. CW19]|uniref:CYTH and CHAD domain-containing protein n=1 Tax=Dietzia sp. CW19 TaxID=1630634 RepID=UPI0015FDDCE9|nr:CYTH and CHAD domain-containing protein [Dietzia sp. CW19]MBB1050525.1 CYTH and CHAD domain-containing protein [Dietzia sp. CW19]